MKKRTAFLAVVICLSLFVQLSAFAAVNLLDLAAPGNLKAKPYSRNVGGGKGSIDTRTEILITWKKTTHSKVAILRSTSEKGTYKQIAEVSGNSYYDSTIKPNTKYFYKIKGYVASMRRYGYESKAVSALYRGISSMSLDKAHIPLEDGDVSKVSLKLFSKYSKYPPDTTPRVSYRSSNPKVAQVNGGVVTAVSKGNATITATVKENGKEFSAQCTVNVVNFCHPLKSTSYKVTSAFGMRRGEIHAGIDLGCDTVSVYAVRSGTVISSGWNDATGNYIIMSHKALNGVVYYTAYYHLSNIIVSSGNVSMRQKIAISGNTGPSTGPHLHFGIGTKAGITKSGKLDPEMFIKFR